MNLDSVGVHWFRRDLRVAGNPALQKNFAAHQGRTVGLFCFDSAFLSRSDFSHNRFGFFLATIEKLKEELLSLGSDLLVLDQRPAVALPRIIECLRKNDPKKVITMSYNRDYEPFARSRDLEIEQKLAALKVKVESSRDHLLIEPSELTRDGDKPFYQIYTPFSRKWLELFGTSEIQGRIRQQLRGIDYLKRNEAQNLFKLKWSHLLKDSDEFRDQLKPFIENNKKSISISLPQAGSKVALLRLQDFVDRVDRYKLDRDIPSIDGTSQLSHFYKNGSWTTSQTIAFLQNYKIDILKGEGAHQFLKEIIWREFYYHILYHRPEVETGSFLPQFRNIKWENNEAYFRAWCEGRTGYPIVDAGMRQLLSTGWMHNRVRMIVASFLTKDLLVDWRWGEAHFMKHLIDGDLAPNNGGWQWAASTGCDPQPYFRIFNPALQSEKFDPEAMYIKSHIPELSEVPAKLIHDPFDLPDGLAYPKPIVVHAEQKPKALALYKMS